MKKISKIPNSMLSQVMTSKTDTTTPDAILRRGDFGVGSVGSPPTVPVSDLNDLNICGLFNVAGSFPNWPHGGSGGTLHNNSHGNGTFTTQIAYSAASYRIAVRFKITTIWSPWFFQYTQENIVGTVSQSAGVPTGAIIQRGANANGEFTRFADGTMICWRAEYSISNVGAVWTYPSPFSSTPSVNAPARPVNQGNGELAPLVGCAYSVTTTSSGILVFRAVDVGATASPRTEGVVHAKATGRWF